MLLVTRRKFTYFHILLEVRALNRMKIISCFNSVQSQIRRELIGPSMGYRDLVPEIVMDQEPRRFELFHFKIVFSWKRVGCVLWERRHEERRAKVYFSDSFDYSQMLIGLNNCESRWWFAAWLVMTDEPMRSE